MGEVEIMDTYNVEVEGEKPHEVSFVVHGAKIQCEFGSRWGRLIVPKSHGVYLRKKAQLNKKDSKPKDNVQPMGICSVAKKEPEEVKEEKPKKGLFAFIVDTVKSIFFGKKEEEEEEEVDIGYCMCDPEISMDWQNTHPEVLVEGEEALLSTSFLKCIKGGKITICQDGQEDD